MGIKHCGKSTQGKLIAKHLNCDFFDTDDIITEQTGMTPREIYSKKGKDSFMEAETAACNFLLNRGESLCVIATGGGICNNNDALKALRQIGTFVFLNTSESIACNRIVHEARILKDGTITNLPAYIAKEDPQNMSDVRNCFHTFYVARQKIYQSICDIRVDMKVTSKSENLKEILSALSIMK